MWLPTGVEITMYDVLTLRLRIEMTRESTDNGYLVSDLKEVLQ